MRTAIRTHVAPQEVGAGAGRRADGARALLQTFELTQHDVPAFDDGRLLGEDRLARGPQHLRVLERDGGDNDHGSREHVRRVQAAAEPGFDAGGRHACPRHGQEGGHGQHLELRRLSQRRRKTLHGSAHDPHGGAESAFVHGAAQHQHAFGKARDMRRQVRSAAQTVRADERLHIARRRRLAVRAHHMHGAKRRLGTTEVLRAAP